MSLSYSFIPFLKKEKSVETAPYKSGKIHLNIEALTPIHISQDYYELSESGFMYKEFYTFNNQYAIPGSSLRGVIRTISECVSNSCPSSGNLIDKRFRCEQKKGNKYRTGKEVECVGCKTFGVLGYKSKVRVFDFLLEDSTKKMEIVGLPQMHKPNSNQPWYKDENGNFIGYKLYYHGVNSELTTGEVKCNYAMEGCIFKGVIMYDNLSKEQLMLLCYSLSLAGDFNHKIGYGKPYNYGSIKITIDEEKTTDAKELIDLAMKYKNTTKSDIKRNIEMLNKVYSFENAKID